MYMLTVCCKFQNTTEKPNRNGNKLNASLECVSFTHQIGTTKLLAKSIRICVKPKSHSRVHLIRKFLCVCQCLYCALSLFVTSSEICTISFSLMVKSISFLQIRTVQYNSNFIFVFVAVSVVLFLNLHSNVKT